VAASPTPAPSPDPCGGTASSLLATLNRPSIGFSPCAVKPHEAILEAGYANSFGDGVVPNYPQALLRVGTRVSGLEVDLSDNGKLDSGLGAKYEAWHDAVSSLAFDWIYTAPTGNAAQSLGAPTQTFNIDYGTQISSKLSAGSTLGMQSAGFLSLLPSAVLTDQWNDRAQAFVEVFGQTRTRPDGGALIGTDIALQYLLLPQLELDIEAGGSANDVARTHYLGFGFGARF
jgi:hypothetical protein